MLPTYLKCKGGALCTVHLTYTIIVLLSRLLHRKSKNGKETVLCSHGEGPQEFMVNYRMKYLCTAGNSRGYCGIEPRGMAQGHRKNVCKFVKSVRFVRFYMYIGFCKGSPDFCRKLISTYLLYTYYIYYSYYFILIIFLYYNLYLSIMNSIINKNKNIKCV